PNTSTPTASTSHPHSGNTRATSHHTFTPPPPLPSFPTRRSSDLDPVTVGSPLTYTLTVHNNGPDTSTGVSLSDPLPAGVTFVSTSTTQGTCTGTTTLTCALGTLANGASATVTIVVTPNNTGTLTN